MPILLVYVLRMMKVTSTEFLAVWALKSVPARVLCRHSRDVRGARPLLFVRYVGDAPAELQRMPEVGRKGFAGCMGRWSVSIFYMFSGCFAHFVSLFDTTNHAKGVQMMNFSLASRMEELYSLLRLWGGHKSRCLSTGK